MNEIKFNSAKYINNPISGERDNIEVDIDGVIWGVPLDPDNRHYAEILKQVAAGELTIKDAD